MATRTFGAARRAVPTVVALAVVTGCTAGTVATVATAGTAGTAAKTTASTAAGTSASRAASTTAGPSTATPASSTESAVSACALAQLTLTYRGGGAGAGNDMGTIVFRDTSGRACRLTGTVAATGLSAAGAPDTATIKAAVASPGLLSPHAAPVPDGAPAPAGELLYGWLLMAEYRDGPASVDNGFCQPDWVIPASWRVTLPGGATVVVPNKDPGDVIGLQGAAGGLVACRGQLDTAVQPAYLDS
jgi:hypothetical protein